MTLTAVRSDCGQPGRGPSGVVDQSLARMSVPSSPPSRNRSPATGAAGFPEWSFIG